MALKPFNVAGGLTVGDVANAVITASGNVITPNLTVDTVGTNNGNGNISFGSTNLVTTGTFYGNIVGNISGNIVVPGANTQVLFNNNGNAGANVNLTFDSATQNLTTNGNIIVTTGTFVGNGSSLTNIAGANVTGTVGNANIANTAGTVTTNAQPNITSVGNLTGLTVDGISNLGAVGNVRITGGTTGQFISTDGAGNLSFASISSSSLVNGNSNVVVAANGNVTISSAGNANILIATDTGVNVTGTLNASGNITGANLTTGGLVEAVGNIQSNGTVITNDIAGRTTGVTITAAGSNQNINLVPTGTGSVNVGNFIISNLATPVASTDAATKQYVDDIAQGLHTHDSCNAATQTTLASISGGTVTYNNGTDGVGANLTTTGTFTTIDGVNLVNGMRILVKNEANAAHNGIYNRTSSTVLTRSSDFDTPAEMAGGDFTFVTGGDSYDNTGWVMTDPVTTVGTSPVPWVQFSGAGTYTAGTGLTLDGSQFSISNTTVTAGSYGNGDSIATFTVNSQGQLTSAADVAIAANAANLTGTTLASGITTSSLTTVGTLGSLTVTGNITGGNLITTGSGGNITMSGGNITGANVITANTIVASTGNITGGNLTTGGALSVTGNANVGNLGTATAIITTGNITTINSGLLQNGNSNVTLAANGNITLTATGNATMVITDTGANITGTANISGNANVGNLGTGGLISATGNITGGNLSTTGTATIGNSVIAYSTVTTTSTTTTTLVDLTAPAGTAVEFIVKGVDAVDKRSVSTIMALSEAPSGTEWTIYGTISGANGAPGTFTFSTGTGTIQLRVIPASSTSTVWTTQYRYI